MLAVNNKEGSRRVSPEPRRVEDKVLTLTWFRGRKEIYESQERLNFHLDEIEPIDPRMIPDEPLSKVHNGFLCYSSWTLSSFRQNPEQMKLAFPIRIIEFVSDHGYPYLSMKLPTNGFLINKASPVFFKEGYCILL